MDFTEDNGSDPLGVHAFAHDEAYNFKNNKLARIWGVIDENRELIGFFTTSMTSIEANILPNEERVENITPKQYPAMLLGQMGLGKKHRGKKIGSYITHFCTGLALHISKRVACRYLVLQTDESHLEYYKKYCRFTPATRMKGRNLIMMYRRLF